MSATPLPTVVVPCYWPPAHRPARARRWSARSSACTRETPRAAERHTVIFEEDKRGRLAALLLECPMGGSDVERFITLSGFVRCGGGYRVGLRHELTHGADADAVHLHAFPDVVGL